MSKLAELLRDEKWRLWNLYQVKTDAGQIVPFQPNRMQERFLREIHWNNNVLKSRRLGFSTLSLILFLDRMLFVPHQQAGLIDYKLDAAKRKMKVLQYAYRTIGLALGGDAGKQMNELIHRMVPVDWSNTESMGWKNGSAFYAGTGYRGDGLQYLHVSEFGKIAASSEEVAAEIIEGALQAAKEALVIFESTHENGRQGRNYKMLKDAMENPTPGRYEFKFHFFPWHEDPLCRIKNSRPVMDSDERRYFAELKENHGLTFDDEQLAFYLNKWRSLGFAVKKEFPSVPEDAFDAPMEGAYYGNQIAYLRAKGRIHEFEHERYPVHCFWDIGRTDSTAIWAVQLVGPEIWWLDWYESEDEPPSHYVSIVNEWATRYPIVTHFLPHDAGYGNAASDCYKKVLYELGLRNTQVIPRTPDIFIGINELRELLKRSRFHIRTARTRMVDGEEQVGGVGHLELYHKHTNKAGSALRERPVHDEHSHSADAARYFAEAYRHGMVGREFAQPKRNRRGGDTILAV